MDPQDYNCGARGSATEKTLQRVDKYSQQEYDLMVDFTRLEGEIGPELMLGFGGQSFRWTTGGGYQWYGPLWVNGSHWRVKGPLLKLGQRYQVRMVVRENGFGGFVNGKKVDWLEYTGQNLHNPAARIKGTVGLRVPEDQNVTAFHRFMVREVTEPGKMAR
jgi:hypothetical protein